MMTNMQHVNLKNILLMSGAILLAMFLISSYAWAQIPAGTEVCTHWNAAGKCDDYGSKFVGIFLMPIIAAGIVLLFASIPRIEPRATNIAQSGKAYTAVWLVMLLFFLAIHIVLMLDILGMGVNITTVLPVLIGLLFVVIGNYMGKVRSNFFFGIRTPWTLSSELAWNKTHRLGGKLFVLLGLLFMVGAVVVPGESWVFWLVGGNLLMVAVLMLYSYLVWKGDTEARAH